MTDQEYPVIYVQAINPNDYEPHIYRRLCQDFRFYARHCLKIVNKAGELVPLIFTESQEILHKEVEEQLAEIGMVRIDLIKGRQQHMSTYILGRFYWHAATKPNRTVSILSHEADSTYALFDKAKTFQEHAPGPVRPEPEKSNRQELKFSNGSLYMLSTAGSGTSGRSRTAQYQHQSERAFMPNIDQVDSGVGEVVADLPGTEIFRETTGNGKNHMYDNVKDDVEGKSIFKVVFIPWHVQKEYRTPPRKGFARTEAEQKLVDLYKVDDAQLQWRRDKIGKLRKEWLFRQEYPNYLWEAFQTPDGSFFDPDDIQAAMQCTIQFPPSHPVIIGCDPARTGDRTVIAVRDNRTFFDIQKFDEMPNTMRLVGILASLINKYEAEKCFVDYALGYGVVDRLRELGYGYIVDGVQFGEAADDEQYANKRAEMAFRLRDWLKDGARKLPDDRDMEADMLMLPDFKQTSSGKLIFPSKDEIRAIHKRSPDILDAMMLTFARHVRSQEAMTDPAQRNRTKQTRSPLSTMRYIRESQRQRGTG